MKDEGREKREERREKRGRRSGYQVSNYVIRVFTALLYFSSDMSRCSKGYFFNNSITLTYQH
ncbi:MAG: hypothetical protein COT45_01800 [bacterium (Candidatus Stahlbacteria) CG08_land_8_20_14_0_20_40_26]|nr:MAG: hypothetical protein COT45_01800 [bacterium (Candidatus Stahlbacteria) CG08_land_8_20_14_0_20_40_26]